MRRSPAAIALAAAIAFASGDPALAQGTEVSVGGLRADPTLPVEVTSDSLAVSQTDGTATFKGNVIIGQGEMRISAEQVVVEYEDAERTRIERLIGTGGVTMVSGDSAAEAAEATYTIDTPTVVMTGEGLLPQAGSAMSGEKLTVDLTTGAGLMEGRVKTVLQPGGN